MRFYELLSEHYDDLFPVTPAELDFLSTALDGRQGGTIVDIGCGTGGHAIALAQLGHHVVGLDLEPEMIARARLRAVKELVLGTELTCKSGAHGRCIGADFHVADMLSLPMSDGVASACVCIGNTIAHLPTPDHVQRAMVEMARVLREGGITILQVVGYDRVLRMGHVDLPDIHLPQKGIVFHRRYEAIDTEHVVFRSTLAPSDGSAPGDASEVMMTPLSRQFMEATALGSGLDIARVCGDFAGSPYLTTSPALVMVLKKALGG